MNDKLQLHLTRYTTLTISKEEVEEYLEECVDENIEPTLFDFLENYLIGYNSFDVFHEEVEETEVDNKEDFNIFVKEIRNE